MALDEIYIQLEIKTHSKMFFLWIKNLGIKVENALIKMFYFLCVKKDRGQSIRDPYFILNPAGNTGGSEEGRGEKF